MIYCIPVTKYVYFLLLDNTDKDNSYNTAVITSGFVLFYVTVPDIRGRILFDLSVLLSVRKNFNSGHF